MHSKSKKIYIKKSFQILSLRSLAKRKKAQTMTEYLVIVCLLAVGSVFAIQQFSNVVRAQIGQAAHEIAGSTQYSGVKAEEQAGQIDKQVKKSLSDFYKNTR